ncbi:MRPS23 [Cervus elaphus hippelaphus]|uniref:Small ribosomal subunit protein mS23 n=1 Tax=Cervus elaphus hippelaphus TaxID=46360 RepID=A0A212D6Y8_CEREH|nr:MRPS23 [Cervus elaphus hippelaphus]
MYCFCPALALSRPGGSAIECSCLSLASSRGCGDSAILCFCLATPSRWSRNAGTAIGGSARDFRPLCLPRALPVPVQAQRGIQGPGHGGQSAGNRGERFHAVRARSRGTRDLIRAGVLKEKPLWFDIYNAFPPLRDPVFRRPRLRYGKAKSPTQDIFYHEDQIRAKFYSAYGSGPKAFDLFNPNFKSTCQRFVEKYIELQKLGETDEEKLFVEAGKALLAEGVILRRVEKARTQQEGSQVSWKSEPMGVESQTVLEENPPLKEVPQAQHLEAPAEESKGLSPP